MGNVSRRIKRKFLQDKAQDVPVLSQEDFEIVQNLVAELMVGDALMVICDILQNHWGQLNKKDTRLQIFGALFKTKYRTQGFTHNKKYEPLIEVAGLKDIKYGC